MNGEQELSHSSGHGDQVSTSIFFVKDSACGACPVLAPVTDQVELTVRRLLALASTGCGASCVLQMHSVGWCSVVEGGDGLINHYFPQLCT